MSCAVTAHACRHSRDPDLARLSRRGIELGGQIDHANGAVGGSASGSAQHRRPLADNTKPVLYAVGDKDPNVTPETVRAIADGIGGPVTVEIFAGGPHQLMLFETEAFSTLVHGFCTGAVSRD